MNNTKTNTHTMGITTHGHKKWHKARLSESEQICGRQEGEAVIELNPASVQTYYPAGNKGL